MDSNLPLAPLGGIGQHPERAGNVSDGFERPVAHASDS
jgi:hypothetical protein